MESPIEILGVTLIIKHQCLLYLQSISHNYYGILYRSNYGSIALKPLPKTQTTEFRVYLEIQESTVLGVRRSNLGVIASYFGGFGVTGMT